MADDHLFQKGQEKPAGSGRKLGVRNRLSERFLKDLHDEWERSGSDCLKILAKENPEALARLAIGVVPKEYEGQSDITVRTIVTGVIRHGDEPSLPIAPPVALPSPKKEPVAEAQPLMTADLTAELPKMADIPSPQPAKVEAREKLIYAKPTPRIGWR